MFQMKRREEKKQRAKIRLSKTKLERRRRKKKQAYVLNVNFHCLTGEKIIFAFIVFSRLMGLRDVKDFEQMTTSGPVPASEAKQNGARRHSHSFRPLHDVGGIKAAPRHFLRKSRGETPGG